MYSVLFSDEIRRETSLWNQMHRHRAAQFVARHAWPLSIDAAGRELDAFDDARARYAIVRQGGRLLAATRIRPGRASMLEPVFPSLWNRAGAHLERGLEVTRFCAAPDITGQIRMKAVSDLLLGLCRTALSEGVGHVFGVVFPTVARTIRQAGWPAIIHASDADPSGTLLLAEWQATELNAWNLQASLERRRPTSSFGTGHPTLSDRAA